MKVESFTDMSTYVTGLNIEAANGKGVNRGTAVMVAPSRSWTT